MSTQLQLQAPFKMYGVTEKKKAELDDLTLQVLDAQHDVEQFQAMVDSLTEKSVKFLALLDDAGNNRARTLKNKDLIDDLVKRVRDLKANSNITFTEIGFADESNRELVTQMNTVISKLIFSAEVINKLAILVVRKKALNPLISEELVSMINTAGSDANNAVALALVALKSSFAANATAIESESAIALEYQQSLSLWKLLTGTDENMLPDKDSISSADKKIQNSLYGRLYIAFEAAKVNYENITKALLNVNSQLNDVTASLNKAQVKLNSLQLGLSAGNAAALAG